MSFFYRFRLVWSWLCRVFQPRPPKVKDASCYLYLLWAWGFSLAGIFMGPVFISGSIAVIATAMQTKRWPGTVGTVISSKVAEHRGRGVNYSPEIAYQYRVSETEYIGTRLSLNSLAADETWAQKTVAEFPVGASVQVFYKPSQPASSVLRTGVNEDMFIGLGVSIMVFSVAIVVCPARTLLYNRSAST